MKYFLPIIFLFFITSIGCKSGKFIKLTDVQKAILLDSSRAAQAIIDDDIEGFFEKISKVDMDIQLKKNHNKNTPRGIVLDEYKDFLKHETASFSRKEKALVEKALKNAVELCNRINPNIVPPEIELIKIHGTHYGPGVWYTRENRIIIPKDVLNTEGRNNSEVEADLTQTFLHEIFHIFSRYNAEKRMKLYSLIGFKNVSVVPLVMVDALKERMLLNPDGINPAQVIDLRTDSSTISAIPIITANEPDYIDTKPDFFSYIKFDLYQVVKGKGGIKVISNKDGTSTLNLREMKDFFRKIGDNTDYIIHPDEILADNFALLALSQKDKSSLDKLSAGGKALVRRVEDVLRDTPAKP